MVQGRDANRNLQRSLKATKLRSKLPGAVQQLAEAVAQWQDERGSPFMCDGRPLQVLPLNNCTHIDHIISSQGCNSIHCEYDLCDWPWPVYVLCVSMLHERRDFPAGDPEQAAGGASGRGMPSH